MQDFVHTPDVPIGGISSLVSLATMRRMPWPAAASLNTLRTASAAGRISRRLPPRASTHAGSRSVTMPPSRAESFRLPHTGAIRSLLRLLSRCPRDSSTMASIRPISSRYDSGVTARGVIGSVFRSISGQAFSNSCFSTCSTTSARTEPFISRMIAPLIALAAAALPFL